MLELFQESIVKVNLDSLSSSFADFILKAKYKDFELYDYDEVNNIYIYKDNIISEYDGLVDELKGVILKYHTDLSEDVKLNINYKDFKLFINEC